MQVNAIINSTSTAGKKISTTISHLRESQESKATQLGQMLNALTTNTLNSVQINEINIDTAGKTEPILALENWSSTSGGYYATLNYNGDGTLFINCNAPAQIEYNSPNIYRVDVKATTFSGTIYATETDKYAAKTLEFNRG